MFRSCSALIWPIIDLLQKKMIRFFCFPPFHQPRATRPRKIAPRGHPDNGGQVLRYLPSPALLLLPLRPLFTATAAPSTPHTVATSPLSSISFSRHGMARLSSAAPPPRPLLRPSAPGAPPPIAAGPPPPQLPDHTSLATGSPPPMAARSPLIPSFFPFPSRHWSCSSYSHWSI